MEFHRGRLVDHLHMRVRDLEASKRFYRAVLDVLAIDVLYETDSAFAAPATTPPTCSTRTGTTPRRCPTGRPNGRRRRW